MMTPIQNMFFALILSALIYVFVAWLNKKKKGLGVKEK